MSDSAAAFAHWAIRLVAEARGAGPLVGMGLTEPGSERVRRAAQDAGFLVNAAGPTTVRLAPALNVPEAQVDALLEALPGILGR